MMNNRISALLLVESANPEWVSVPLVGWSLANALRKEVDAHLVTQIRNRKAILKAGLLEGKDFTSLDSELIARPLWRLANLLRGGKGKGWTTTTAISAIAYYYFEYLVWKRFGASIRAGEYDVVHRITPLSPTIPSLIARKCRKAGTPFLVGPLNGGVPWPKGFDGERRQEKEWLSYVRGAYKLLPGYAGTLAYSSALFVGSRYTFSRIPENYWGKCVYLPENAVDPDKFSKKAQPYDGKQLRVCFVGRMVPYKGADMLLEAALPLLKAGAIHIDFIGDGPILHQLKEMTQGMGVNAHVAYHGWVSHDLMQDVMCKSQVLAFPSIREFGGGVVLEAMALGVVPLIVDYAGPGELVDDKVGIKVPLGSREEIVSSFRYRLKELIAKPESLTEMSETAISRVKEYFTWPVKAKQVCRIYKYVRGIDNRVDDLSQIDLFAN